MLVVDREQAGKVVANGRESVDTDAVLRTWNRSEKIRHRRPVRKHRGLPRTAGNKRPAAPAVVRADVDIRTSDHCKARPSDCGNDHA